MEIIKNLYQAGKRVGVLIEDGTERYPVPLEGLFARTIFDELKTSGYTLTNVELPEFVKNGCKISELPGEGEEWVPTDEENMLFLNTTLTYEMIPIAERFSLCETASVKIAERVGSYTINTREEFMEYINQISAGCFDDDYLPINYFVAPEARFELVELMGDPEVVRALNILANRRRFNFARLKRLKKFLTSCGLPVSTPAEIIDGYMEWGFDGVNIAITGKNTELTSDNPMVEEKVTIDEPFPGYAQLQRANAQFHTIQPVLVGKNINAPNGVLFPGDIPGVEPIYRVSDKYKNRPIYVDVTSPGSKFGLRRDRLGVGEYGAEQIFVFEQQPVRTWYLLDAYNTFVYTNEQIRLRISVSGHELRERYGDDCDGTSRSAVFNYNNLCVQNPANFYMNIPLEFWDDSKRELLKKISILRTIAHNTYLRGEVPCDKSSYSLLTALGCSPYNAVRTIATMNKFFDTSIIIGGEDGNSIDPSIDKFLCDDDVISYFAGGCTGELMVPSFYRDGSIKHDRNIVAGDMSAYTLYPVDRKVELIEDIIRGGIDLGAISRARAEQAMFDSSPAYRALYCAHFILGMPIDLISEKCAEYDNQGVGFTLEYNGTRIYVPMPRCDLAAKAAASEEVTLYKTRIIEAPTFFMIYDVARELSNNENLANKPIGVAGVYCRRLNYNINANHDNYSSKETGIDKVIERLVTSYLEAKASGAFLTAAEQEKNELEAHKAARLAILTFYAYGSLERVTGCPADWSDVLNENATLIANCCGRFADSLIAITSDYYDYADSKGNYSWNYYCVNADVFPDKVVPHGSLCIHETNIRAVYDDNTIAANFNVLVERGLIAKTTYFANERSSWSMYDYTDGHLNAVPHIKKALTVFAFEFYKDADLYKTLCACTMKNLDDRIEEFSNENPRYRILADYAISTYYKRAVKLQAECPDGQWFVAPKHPVVEAYPSIYGNAEETVPNSSYRPVVDPTTDKKNYPVGKAAAIVGPQYDNVSGQIGGLPVKQPIIEKVTRALNEAPTVVSGKLELMDRFSIDDLVVHPELIDLDFGGKEPIMIMRGYVFAGGEHVELNMLDTLDSSKHAVHIVDGRTCIIQADTGRLYRVTV